MTIEERALEKYPIFISEYSDSCAEYDSNESDRINYIEGATDQKKIDIEKACEWLRISEIANFSELQIKFFKKAMEE